MGAGDSLLQKLKFNSHGVMLIFCVVCLLLTSCATDDGDEAVRRDAPTSPSSSSTTTTTFSTTTTTRRPTTTTTTIPPTTLPPRTGLEGSGSASLNFGFTTEAGWSYNLSVTSIRALDFTVDVTGSPPGKASVKASRTGPEILNLTSLDAGRDAPDYAVLVWSVWELGTRLPGLSRHGGFCQTDPGFGFSVTPESNDSNVFACEATQSGLLEVGGCSDCPAARYEIGSTLLNEVSVAEAEQTAATLTSMEASGIFIAIVSSLTQQSACMFYASGGAVQPLRQGCQLRG